MNATQRDFLSRRALLLAGTGAVLAIGLHPIDAAVVDEQILRRKIPSSGEMLPAIGLGTGGFGTGGLLKSNTPEARAALGGVLQSLVAAHATIVDTASTYGSAEDVIGAVVTADKLRDKLFIATKMEATEPVGGLAELRRSLQRLQTSRVNLVQLHNVSDPQQSLAMFRDFVAQGLCRYFGVTSTHPQSFSAMETVVRREKPNFMEVGYSIGDRQAEERLLPAARDAGTAVLAAQPVGGGRDPLFRLVQGKPLPDFAKDLEVESWAQFFLKYVLGNTAVTAAIPGTASAAHMTDDLAAMRGRMPDASERKKMVAYFDSVRS